MDVEKYFLVILRRPEDHPDLSEDEVSRLQIGHLAFHNEMREQGRIAFNGPVREGPDEALRGLSFYCTATAAEALELARRDPMVQANWLAADVMEFWTQPGAVQVHGIAFTV